MIKAISLLLILLAAINSKAAITSADIDLITEDQTATHQVVMQSIEQSSAE